jgi:hypothetical protein
MQFLDAAALITLMGTMCLAWVLLGRLARHLGLSRLALLGVAGLISRIF